MGATSSEQQKWWERKHVGGQKTTRETEEDGVLKDAPNVMRVGKNLPASPRRTEF